MEKIKAFPEGSGLSCQFTEKSLIYLPIPNFSIMAFQEGPFEFNGRLGRVVGYTVNGKKVVRTIGKTNKNDPKNEQVMGELSSISSYNRLFRELLSPFISDLRRKQLDNAVTKLFNAVRQLDPTPYGEGSFAAAMHLPKAPTLFYGFELNEAPAYIRSMLHAQLRTDRESRTVFLSCFTPSEDLDFPKGSGHARISASIARMDIENGGGSIVITDEVIVSSEDSQELALSFGSREKIMGSGIYFALIKIAFSERLNGIDYPLAGSRYGCMVVDCWRE
jgi:hypothetical protein